MSPADANAEFEDIRIVDLDLAKTTWSRVHESLRVMFLRLDREPPDTDWPRLFFEERETRIVARRRGLWIEENYISFDSLPEEVEKIHLPDIRQSIAYANRKYRELCVERRLKRLENLAEQRSERDEMLSLQARIRGLLAGDGESAGSAPPAAAVAASARPAAAVPAPRTATAPVVVAPVASPPAASAPTVPALTPAAAAAAVPAAAAAAKPATAPVGDTTQGDAPAAASSNPLAEFELRRNALKQVFRAAASQDKEQK